MRFIVSNVLIPRILERMKCCVVGCGAAGIVAAKHLKHAAIQFDVFERTDDIGGTWIYTEKQNDSFGNPVHTAMYKNLRTNLPKEVMEFEGFKYNVEKSFISSTDVYAYLKRYVKENNLMDHIKLGHLVKNISHENNNWEVTVEDLREGKVDKLTYNAVMVCNGHFYKPRIPKIEGQDEFIGLQMHSKKYRVPEIFKSKNVLVIGFGPSGQDISHDISKEANKVFLSNHAPNFKEALFNNNVISKPDVRRLNHNSVTFQDGSLECIDAILYCTGYFYEFAFLDESCGITVDDNYVKPLHRHLLNIHHPTMAFIGIPFKTFILPLFEVQVKAFIQLLLGEASLPKLNAMWDELNTFENYNIDKSLSKRKYHQLESVPQYIHQLNTMANLKDLPQVLYKIYDYNFEKRLKNLVQYRNYVYEIIDEDNFTVKYVENKDN